jgi:hypothetical protein
MPKLFLSLLVVFLFSETSVHAATSTEAELQSFSPALFTLYGADAAEVPTLRNYAVQQGFSEAHEQLTIIVHELIHIESARLSAYWVAGQGYEGYLPGTWPALPGRDLAFTPAEKAQLGVIYDNYLQRNPDATLRNVVDELNAYSQTAGFVCAHAPASANKQTLPLLGHLALANAFLKTYPPSTIQALRADPVAKGIMSLVVRNSYKTLSTCGIFAVGNQEAIRAFLQ